MEVRLADAKDREEISKLVYLFEDKKVNKDKTMLYMQPKAKMLLAVAEIEKKIVGYCHAIFIHYKPEKGKEGYIQELYVKEEYRKKGIGKRLVKFIVKELIKLGASVIFVTAPRDNPAQKIYKTLGFKRDRNWFYLDTKKISCGTIKAC